MVRIMAYDAALQSNANLREVSSLAVAGALIPFYVVTYGEGNVWIEEEIDGRWELIGHK